MTHPQSRSNRLNHVTLTADRSEDADDDDAMDDDGVGRLQFEAHRQS
jgi:hypothetical protein